LLLNVARVEQKRLTTREDVRSIADVVDKLNVAASSEVVGAAKRDAKAKDGR
jgi:hypothetical protein